MGKDDLVELLATSLKHRNQILVDHGVHTAEELDAFIARERSSFETKTEDKLREMVQINLLCQCCREEFFRGIAERVVAYGKKAA